MLGRGDDTGHVGRPELGIDDGGGADALRFERCMRRAGRLDEGAAFATRSGGAPVSPALEEPMTSLIDGGKCRRPYEVGRPGGAAMPEG